MSRIIDVVPGTGVHMFFCPGCQCGHWFSTDGSFPGWKEGKPKTAPVWTWNGDREKPTVRASVLVKHGLGIVCHSMVTDGKISFMADSNHELSGKTVELPDWDFGEEESVKKLWNPQESDGDKNA